MYTASLRIDIWCMFNVELYVEKYMEASNRNMKALNINM
jgi:hypothetical protein